MNCCGSKRKSFGQTPENHSTETGKMPSVPSAVFVKFKYVGLRAMTVTGGITGAVYRFAQAGAELMVDKRDAPGMGAVPNIERV